MSTIPQGAQATIIIQDAQTVSGINNALNANDVNDAVAAYLSGLGYQVLTTSESGGIAGLISPLIQETYQSTIVLLTPWDIDSASLAQTVSQAFGEVTGQFPSQITIPTYTLAGVATSTGQPQPTSTTAQAAAAVGSGIAQQVSNFFAQLTAEAKSLLIGLAAILIIALVLIAYGPNVKGIVAAAV